VKLLVEGWRFVPHSYALVNHWQCLELLRRPGISLSMTDLPHFDAMWKPVRGLMPAADEAALARIEDPLPAATPDAVLRLSVPARLAPAPHGRTLVLCTSDFGWLPARLIADRRSLKASHAETDVVLLTPSKWAAQGLIHSGADARRVAVVPHGVDTSVFHPAAAPDRERLRAARGWQERFVFLNVSAMSLNKGIDVLLKAFARVAMKHAHAHLVLKGLDAVYKSRIWADRWMSEKLTAQERRQVKGRILYTGNSLPVAALADLFRAADAYVTPYRAESFNLPALEAAACGLPLICTAGGPTDEFTTEDFALRIAAKLEPRGKGEPGEVELRPDLDALTDAMLAVIEKPAYRDTARAAGPAYVSEHFSWSRAVDRLLEVMRQ
jgi:glycosyltransferase involved in cell wall biosynthesis